MSLCGALKTRVSTLVSEGSPTSAIGVGCLKMFENLTNKLEKIFSKLKSAPSLTEEQVNFGLKEIRLALLEADVALPVVKDFIANIKPKAIGQEIIKSTSPGQMIVKIVYDELVSILGSKNEELNFKAVPPVSILLVGLQGSGKTTSAAKLAKLIEEKYKKKVMLVSLDVYRPAAQEQLKLLAENNGIQNLPIIEKQQPLDITKRALNVANLNGSDIIIFDTAGRTQIDLPMMSEIKQVKEMTNPAETFLVADSLTGQIAVNVAKEFDTAVNLSSIILTRIDGDARGGAALSMKHVTGKPIKYIGVGEKISDFELFHPDRLANRILGMGDVVTLVEKAAQDLGEEKLKETEEELKKGIFTMDSYLSQLRQMKKMGGMEGVMSMLPGANKMKEKMDQANIDEKMLIENEALILSMTKKEKENPKIISGSRRKRISKGSGVDISKINKLLKQFKMMSDMMRKMSQGKKIPSGMIPDEMLNQLK
jgi:signal recognition particle subunit SRP54